MGNKFSFFIKKKKVLWMIGLIAFMFTMLYLFRFHITFNLESEIENSLWNIIISLSCGYLISLVFYIMLVFNSDYNEYLKKVIISKRVYEYYCRIDTAITEMFNCLISASECKDIAEVFNQGFSYSELKEKEIWHNLYGIKECKIVFEKEVRNVNENLNRIEPYIAFLNKNAINVFIELQKTYIFENIDNDTFFGDFSIFDSAVSNFLDKLIEVDHELKLIRDGGKGKIIDE